MPRLISQPSDNLKNYCLGSIVSGHPVKENINTLVNKACKQVAVGLVTYPILTFLSCSSSRESRSFPENSLSITSSYNSKLDY